MNIGKEKQKEFERAASPLIEFLRKTFHPHVTVLVDCCSAEFMEGVCSFVDPESQEDVCQKK
jgi:2'-5' RNA ligase